MRFLNRAHRFATICAVAPLVLGIAIFVVWLLVRRDWLMIAGAVALYGGLAVLAAGVVALAYSSWTALRTPGVERRRVRTSVVICGGLLGANVLAAGAILSVVVTTISRYTVVIHNSSHQQQLDSVQVSGGGCDVSYGSILPGAVARRSFWIRRDGVLVFRASHGDDVLGHTVDDYVMNNGGGHVTVTVRPDLRIAVTRTAPTQLTVLERIRAVAFWRDRSFCENAESRSSKVAQAQSVGAVASPGQRQAVCKILWTRGLLGARGL